MAYEMIKEIPGFSGQYATTEGLIFSTRNGGWHQKPMRLHKGYYRVNLRDDNIPAKTRVEPVHKIILETFVGKRPDGYVCRHLNGNPLDNRLSNICWGTPKENIEDSIRHGTAVCLRHGEDSNAAKLTLDDVKEIRKLYAQGHLQKELASVFSISQHHVSDIVNGKTWCKDLFDG